jgi:S1-C subfamily serine protease
MATVVKILTLAFGSIGTVLALFGETWRTKENGFSLRRVTKLGWAAIGSLVLALGFGITKEFLEKHEDERSQRREEELQSQLEESSRIASDLHAEIRSTRESLDKAIVALSEIANAEEPKTSSSHIAAGALDRIFNLKRLSVVKVKAVIDGMLREKTGFFINSQGSVLTADFAVTELNPPRHASDITIETGNGSNHSAEIAYVDKEFSIAVLSTGIKNESYLVISNRSPVEEEEVLVLGYSEHESLTRTSGFISKMGDVGGLYLRDRDVLPGFGGGPVLALNGLVIGLNWGALVPPVQGNAKFIRSDGILKSLRDQEIFLDPT